MTGADPLTDRGDRQAAINVKRFGIHIAAFALYFGIAILITYPLITHFSTRMIGHPFGDAYEYTRHIWWINHALRTGQPIFQHPTLVYPDGLSGAWLWAIPLQSFPAWLFLFFMPLPAAFNLSALITLALNGWAMFALTRSNESRVMSNEYVLGSTHYSALSTQHSALPSHHSSLIAGLVFMLYPTMQGHLAAAHTGLLVLWGVPLYVLMLLRLRDTRVRKRAPRAIILAGGFFLAASMWGSILQVIFVVAPLTLAFVVWLLVERDWTTLRRSLLLWIAGAVFAAPFVIPVLLEALTVPAAVQEGTVRYSASALAIVSPSFMNPVFSALDYPHQVLGVDPFEGAAYIGIMPALLVIVGIVKRRSARPWLIAAAVAWLFSLGPLLKLFDAPLVARVSGYATSITLPWALLQDLPIINITRTPARFNFAVGFVVALLAGYGAAVFYKHVRPRWIKAVATLIVMGLIAFEYQLFFPLPTVSGIVPEPIRALAGRGDIRAVVNIPRHPLTDKDAMFLQTGHEHPLIGGHITRETPVDPAKAWLLERTLDPALLDAAQVDIVILHKEWADAEGVTEAFTRGQLGEPFYEDETIAAWELPAYGGDPPGFLWIANMPDEVTDGGSVYFYAPEAGEVILNGRIYGAGRSAALYLDNNLLVSWTVNRDQGWNVPVRFDAPGYHTITLRVEPPCPSNVDPALRCRPLSVESVSLDDYRPFRNR